MSKRDLFLNPEGVSEYSRGCKPTDSDAFLLNPEGVLEYKRGCKPTDNDAVFIKPRRGVRIQTWV